jgi:phage terminase large subunit-like protein
MRRGLLWQEKTRKEKANVLEDLSGKYSPNEWGKIAQQAAKNWNADCIVAEKNMGGDMVESVIKSSGTSYTNQIGNGYQGQVCQS